MKNIIYTSLFFVSACGVQGTISSKSTTTSTASSGQSFVTGGNSFSGAATLGTADAYDLSLLTSGLPRMTVTAAGNVVIGTGTPQTLLLINANTASPQTPNGGSNFQLNGADGLSSAMTIDAYGSDFYDSPYVTLRKAQGTAASPLSSNNNDILGSLQYQGYYGGFINGGGLTMDATEAWSSTARGTRLQINYIRTGTTTNMASTFGNNGLGINTVTPGSQLHIAGSVSSSSWTTTGSNLAINAVTSTDTSSAAAAVIATRTSASLGIPTFTSTNNITVTNAANLYIAGAPAGTASTTITNSYAMYIAAGNAYFGGDLNAAAGSALKFNGTTVCTSAGCTAVSDRRYKDNIQPLSDALSKILSLEGVSYDWKEKYQFQFGRKKQIGLIAQDLEKVFPEVVMTDEKTGFKSVMYDHLIAPVIEAIKSLATQVADLMKKDQKQDQQIADLKKENQELKDYLCKKEPRAPFCK